MTDEQLVTEHDNRAMRTQEGMNYYLDELTRRAQERQTKAMLGYTRRMLWLTVFVAFLTVVNVIAVLVPLVTR